MSRTCPNCNASVADATSSCPSCGAALATKRKLPTWLWIVLGLGCGGALLLIGVVLTLVLPRIHESLVLARNTAARADVLRLTNALSEYAIRNGGAYPESLDALVVPDASGGTYFGKPQLPIDPWNHPYRYEPPRSGASDPSPRVWSDGEDGVTGTDDDVDATERD